jgi:hypothetical protein
MALKPRPFEIRIKNNLTGEIYEFNITQRDMTIIARALKAYKSAPQWIADRFDWR